MKCPVCGCQRFFIKDPADEYETHEFDVKQGRPEFEGDAWEVLPETETHCTRCSWHDRFDKLK